MAPFKHSNSTAAINPPPPLTRVLSCNIVLWNRNKQATALQCSFIAFLYAHVQLKQIIVSLSTSLPCHSDYLVFLQVARTHGECIWSALVVGNLSCCVVFPALA